MKLLIDGLGGLLPRVILAVGCGLLCSCSDKLKQEVAQANSKAAEAAARSNRFEADLNALKVSSDTIAKQGAERVSELETELKKKAERITSLEHDLAESRRKGEELGVELIVAKQRVIAVEAKLSVYDAERARAAKEQEEAARRANLVVQLGVTMRSGETKPVTNSAVYLLKRSLLELIPDTFKQDSRLERDLGARAGETSRANAAAVMVFGPLYRESEGRVWKAVNGAAVHKATTDFSGRVSFEGIEPGEYHVLCYTPLGNGAVLEKRVTAKGKSTMIALDNGDILDMFH